MTLNTPLADLLRAGKRTRATVNDLATIDVTPIVVHAGRGAALAVSGGGAYVIIDYDTTDIDPRSAVTTSPNWRFNAVVGGYYWISALCRLAASAAWSVGESADLRVYVNGAQGPSLAYCANIATGGLPLLSGAVLVHLDEDDYVEIKIAQGSGSTINISGDVKTCWVSIARVNG